MHRLALVDPHWSRKHNLCVDMAARTELHDGLRVTPLTDDQRHLRLASDLLHEDPQTISQPSCCALLHLLSSATSCAAATPIVPPAKLR